MTWYKIAETSAEKASFLMLDLSYYPAFLELKKKTGILEKFAAYTDRKRNLVSEFMNDEDVAKKAAFGLAFFANDKNVAQYKSDIEQIIAATNQFKKSLMYMDIYTTSSRELLSLFEKGRVLYRKALGMYLLSQPEYTSGVEEYGKKELVSFVPQDKIEEVFMLLTSSSESSCLEEERIDWLNTIVLPAMKLYKKLSDIESDSNIFKKIKKHIEKYKYYSASFESGVWDEKHYHKILQDDFARGLRKNVEENANLKSKTRHMLKQKVEIIKKYKIGPEILKLLRVVSELGVLRINLRILGWQFFDYLFPLLIQISADMSKISREIVNALSYTEYVSFLEGNLIASDKKTKRTASSLVLITPESGYITFENEAANTKFNSEIREEIKKVKSFKGNVAYRSGIIKGNIFLFVWGSQDFNNRIYTFPENAILVAGQTRPLLMPAIRKAKAIITDEGGLLCHAAIISRELRIPCIIGTKIATKILNDGDEVEIDTNTGFVTVLEKKA